MKCATSIHLSLREQKGGSENIRPEHAMVESWEAADSILDFWTDDTPPQAKRLVALDIRFEDGYNYHGVIVLTPEKLGLGQSIRNACSEAAARGAQTNGHIPSPVQDDMAEEADHLLKEYNIPVRI